MNKFRTESRRQLQIPMELQKEKWEGKVDTGFDKPVNIF